MSLIITIILVIFGLVSLVFLLLGQPLIGIGGLVLCALIVVARNNRKKRALENKRHQEMVDAMRQGQSRR